MRRPTGLGGGELGWLLAQRFFCFVLFVLFVFLFSFRNLVAWFSYLSQYIFTYLLLK